VRLPGARFAAFFLAVPTAQNSGLPAGFQKSTVASGLAEPTAIAFTPDGRLLIGLRGGAVRVVEGGALLPQPLIQLQTDSATGERGLLGLALDPAFAGNGWLYAYYTTPEPRNRVGRFTVVGNSASPASESLVWQNPGLAATLHQGGGIRFGPDGNLYVATGDQFHTPNAQSLATQDGKILRLAPTGGIPPDNPYVGVPGAQEAIWAWGLRNPFRFTFDPPTGAMWIGDVGGNTSTSWEELDPGIAGANYGWPAQEGGACYVSSCSAATLPLYAYRHDDAAFSGSVPQGCIIAGPVYRGGAFPPPYEGNLFVGDYANQWIRRIVFGPGGTVVADPVFEAAPNAGTIVDLAVGPDGALYYATNGIAWVASADSGAVHRIAFVGAANEPPVAAASAAPTQGLPPLGVQFGSGGSSDPNGGPSPLSFSWDFGDGASSSEPSPAHVYGTEGPYTATLTASDGAAQTSATVSIEVGAPPTATILAPPAGTTYRAGDAIAFQGSGEDPETGSLPPSAFTWQVVEVHATHTHPFLGPLSGVAGGSFTVPASGHPPEDSHFEIRLTLVDPSGLAGTDVRPLVPVTTTLVFDSAPSGLPFLLDDQPQTTPRVYQSLVGFEHELAAQAVASVGGAALAFECWSDGGGIAHALVAPAGGMNLTAAYATASATTTSLVVPANVRNAQFHPATGQEYGSPTDPLAICCGRDGGGEIQAGFEFFLPAPQEAFVVEARLRLLATFDQFGSPVAAVRAYAAGSAPAFDAASGTPLTQWAPLASTSIPWAFPPFTPGAVHESPDLSPLVQAVVDRPDWIEGNAIGIVLDGTPTIGSGWRCLHDFLSLVPPILDVTYALPSSPGGGCAGACGFSTYGAGATPAHSLGLVGTGSPQPGGTVVLQTSGIASSGAWTLASPAPASLPLLGGVLLVDPAGALALPFLPSTAGVATWTIAIPSDPTLVGLPLHFQSVAADPAMTSGYAFSPGLRAVLCP
jgi:glucose/arabinose dehydrogenase